MKEQTAFQACSLCECGCGQPVKPGNRYIWGHNLGTGRKVELVCENCGKKVLRYESAVRCHKHNFCSKKCKYEWSRGKPTNPGNKLKPNLSPTPELCYVLGALESDGYVAIGKNGWTGKVELGVKDKEFAEAFASCLRAIGLRPHISFVRREYATNYWLCRAHSIEFVKWFSSLSWTEKRRIATKSRENASSFLRGLIDGDGAVSLTEEYSVFAKKRYVYPRARVVFCNTNETLVDLFIEVAEFLGFRFKKYYQYSDSYKKYGFKGIFRAQLKKRKEVERFLEVVKPCILRKRQLKIG